MFFQPHIANDVGPKRARRMRQNRAAEPGMKLFCDGGSADLRPAFKNQRLETCLGKVERGDKAVVASANNHHIASHGHQAAPFTSFRISRAASRPGAPMIPPPGWVADPQR